MDAEVKRLRERHAKAKAKRDAFSSLIDECYEFALPLRERIYPSGSTRDTDRLFDNTAVDAAGDLAASVLEDVWPSDSRPVVLIPGRGVPEEARGEMTRALDLLTEEVIAAINESNFRAAAGEAMLDWTICDGVLLMEAGTLDEPFMFTALAPSEYVLGVGPRGTYDALYRERKIKHGHLEVLWPGAVLSTHLARQVKADADAEVTVLECSYRKWGERDEVWCYRAIVNGEDEIMSSREDRGPGSCPFIAFSFFRRQSEAVGRGPVQLAIADIRSLNLAAEMLLQHGEMSLAGIWQYDDDGVVNADTITLAPGSLIPKAPGTDGLKNLTPDGDFRFAEFMIERLERRVQTSLFRPDIGDTRKTPRSATEVLQRVADRARRLSRGASRLLTEFLYPLIRRALWIMARLGGARLPRVDGREVSVRALGPITKAQARQDIVDFQQFMELDNASFGPQPMATLVDQEKAIPWLGEQFGVRPHLIRNDAERKKLIEAVQGLAQYAQETGAMPSDGGGGAPA